MAPPTGETMPSSSSSSPRPSPRVSSALGSPAMLVRCGGGDNDGNDNDDNSCDSARVLAQCWDSSCASSHDRPRGCSLPSTSAAASWAEPPESCQSVARGHGGELGAELLGVTGRQGGSAH